VSRDLASTNSGPSLSSELFHASFYKPNQGRIVRQLTALAIIVITALASWSLYNALRGGFSDQPMVRWALPALTLLAGVWFAFRVVNWPRFADFLIAVEAEMNKVTWPSREELIRAAIVVIFTIFFLAIALFIFDVIWQATFDWIGVTG